MAMINANVTTFKFNNSLMLFTVHAHSFYNTSINQYENPMAYTDEINRHKSVSTGRYSLSTVYTFSKM